MNPFKTGWFSVQVISHRLLRWLLPVVLLVAFCANIALLRRPFYAATLVLQGLFYGTALLGWAFEEASFGPALLRVPYYFCAANAASLVAVANWMMRRNVVTWRTNR